jgi:phosphatidylglycerol:prolipoprotein diacylglycerol transferase
MPIPPQSGFTIFGFTIQFYGIIIMLGALAAAFLAEHEAKRKGLKSEFVWDALIWVLIAGIIGARLWHVFTPPPSMQALGYTTKYYLTHPLALINTRAGGLGIPGGVIGGAIGLYLYARHRKMSFWVWADIAAPGVALAQAIGRWGNYFNQELYGKPSNLPWAVHIDVEHRVPGYSQYSTFQPMFLYESLWDLMNMALLLWLSRKYSGKLKDGDIFLIYLVIYPLGRFFFEFLKLDAPRFGTINVNQTIMLVVALVSGFFIFWRHRTKETSPEITEQPNELPEETSQPSETDEK